MKQSRYFVKYIHALIILTLFFLACNFSKEKKSTDSEIPAEKSNAKKYFNYDEIIYYYNNCNPSEIDGLYNNQSRSKLDSLKMSVIIGNTPNNISDTAFINQLEKIGFEKRTIEKSGFEMMDKIFSDSPSEVKAFTACINVYRDILIFKNQGKIIGTAKICFSCHANQIVGSNVSTENFGQHGEYGILEKLLRK